MDKTFHITQFRRRLMSLCDATATTGQYTWFLTFEQDDAGYWRRWCIIREFKIEERGHRQARPEVRITSGSSLGMTKMSALARVGALLFFTDVIQRCSALLVKREYFEGLYCFFTSAEREVKDLRRSEVYPSWQFWDKIGHAKSVGFGFYSAIWRSESRISSRNLEITSISLIYSSTFSTRKELLFWLSWGLNRLTCVNRQIRGDSKLRD